MIDATKLSAQELMAMAALARDDAQAHNCCDWGGLGCRPETLERQSQPAEPAIALIAGAEDPE